MTHAVKALMIGLCLIPNLTACGQEPSFLDRKAKDGNSADVVDGSSGSIDENGTVPGGTEAGGTGTVGENGEVMLPGGDSNDWMPDWADGTVDPEAVDNPEPLPGEGGSTPAGGTTPMPDIPAADDEDLSALHRCLANWKNNPFKGTVTNYQRIYASVTVGGFGNAINDDERTDEPYLILIDAGVNVLGAPVYQLMNPNGYYCMKVNVNVQTNLTINLHCNARLSDSRVNVNVGSTQNDSTSAVGVHVLSTVNVETVRPEGDKCIR